MENIARNQTNSAQAGFTLVELIVVIALFAIIGGVAVGFFLSTLTGRAKAQARMEVQEQARLAVDRMTYEIRRARGIESSSDFGVNLASSPSLTLDLDMSTVARDPTTFSVSGGLLYLDLGTSPAYPLTSDDITITDLTFENRTTANGRSENIAISLTLYRPDPSGTAALDIYYTLQTSVELRGT